LSSPQIHRGTATGGSLLRSESFPISC
jgi:hypothetical protein